MKFFKLLKKELKELITVQAVIGLLVGALMFVLLGNVFGGIGEKIEKSNSSVVYADLDNSDISREAISWLEQDGFTAIKADTENQKEMLEIAAKNDHTTLLLIPKGFGEGLSELSPRSVTVLNEMKSFSMFSNMDSSASNAAEVISKALTAKLLTQEVPGIDIEYLNNPVQVDEVTVVADKSAQISSGSLSSIAMQQSIFIPIIVFLLITFASQLNVSAIANEKSDKTLETLLSTPVSRLAVLGAKMSASAIFSLLMAVVYMVGFSMYFGGMMSGITGAEGAANASGAVLSSLGLALSPVQYLLLGVQLFLTICISLVISLMLGALAKDLKSAQGLISPLLFVTMIPYFITIFLDINSLPAIIKYIIYAIPFTHTFTASGNLMFSNNLLFAAGTIYQLVFLVVILFLAVRIFSSDKIFTMTLGEKRRKKKAVTAE